MIKCMCGGCDACLKDQGVETSAQEATRLQAMANLECELEQDARKSNASFALTYSDHASSETYTAADDVLRFAVTGEQDNLQAAIKAFRLLLLRDYINYNLRGEIAKFERLERKAA